jgi:hypothetical protein
MITGILHWLLIMSEWDSAQHTPCSILAPPQKRIFKMLKEGLSIVTALFIPLTKRCKERGQCILFSVVFTPPLPSHHGSVWFSLSSLY